MKRIELTEDAPLWYRLWSNQAHVLAIIAYAQMALPFWQGVLPSFWFGLLGAVINCAGLFLRTVKQPNLKRGSKNG